MTTGEICALAILEKYHSDVPLKDMCAKLGEEFSELCASLAPAYNKPPLTLSAQQVREARGEIGDCAIILLHMLKRLGVEDPSLSTEVYYTSEKMIDRDGVGYFKKYFNRGKAAALAEKEK